MNQSCLSPISVESDLLAFVIVFQPSQEMGAPLLGKWREALSFSGFVSHTSMWEPVSVEPASQPAFFSLGFVSGTLSPFSSPHGVSSCVAGFLGHRPS